MLRSTLTRTTRRFISTTPRAMAAGDTGGVRSGGEKAGDAYSKREKAAEDMYIKNEERAKLLALKEKIAAEHKHLDELGKHIDDLTKNSGGEHN